MPYDKNGKLNKNFKSKAKMIGTGKATETTNANVMVPTTITIMELAGKLDNLATKVLRMSVQIIHKCNHLSHYRNNDKSNKIIRSYSK